jgi:hypothetical protein
LRQARAFADLPRMTGATLRLAAAWRMIEIQDVGSDQAPNHRRHLHDRRFELG